MATRFFFNTQASLAAITPTPDSEWENTASYSTYRMQRVMYGSAIADKAVTDSTATANRDVLMAQYVSKPLKAQTITGTVKGYIRALEGATASNLRAQVIIRVISPGGTVRGTLLAADSSTGTTDPTSEWDAVTSRNRAFPRGGSVSLGSVAASDGDHLVVEIGYRKHAAASTTGTIRLGDANTGSPFNLAEDETSSTDLNPWIEFSQDLLFVNGGSGTILYLPSTGSPAISPTFSSAWEFSGSGDRIRAVTSPIGSAFSTKGQAETAGNHNGQDIMIRQYVSDPLNGAQSITGFVHGQLRMLESNAGADYSPQFIMRVLQSNGSTVRGTPYAGHSLGLAHEVGTSLRNSFMPRPNSNDPSAETLTTVAASSGDYLVLELGVRISGSTGGFTASAEFGDAATNDLLWEETGTSQLNPWIEFGRDFVFTAPPIAMRRGPYMTQ